MSEQDTDITLAVTPEMELASLKARADAMGITYHPSVGLKTLRERVNAAMTSEGPLPPDDDDDDDDDNPKSDVDVKTVAAAPAKESLEQKRARLKREAGALVRVNISCMNPAKKEWEGEIFTVGNSVVGTFKKFVPFNTTEGWHIPQIMLDQIRERQCQVFTNDKSKNGVTVRKGKLIREFAIEILPPLTKEELAELARRQAMAGSIEQ